MLRVAVPSMPVRQDRTYASALALKDWLAAHNLNPSGLNLMTLGPHARRSRLLFHKALGKGVDVGVISVASQDYDPKHWWHSSQGVRVVLSESIAYTYASLFFHPKRP